MRVERAADLESIEATAWARLAAGATIFQSRPWLLAWWESFGEGAEPLVLLAYDGDELRGIAPFYLDATRTLRFIGHGHSDYNDLLAADDAAADALVAALLEQADRFERAELTNLTEKGALRARLLAQSRRPGLLSEPIDCPRLVMDDPEVARKMRSKKSLRRHFNHFNKQEGFSVVHRSDRAWIEGQLDAFFDQHVERWAGSATPSLFCDEAQRAFYRRVVARFDSDEALRFTRLAVGDAPIAFHLGFVHGTTFTWYKPTYDVALARKSPGEAMLKTLLDAAVEEGLTTFDFTLGGERFKYRFATEVPQVRHLTLYPSAAARLPHLLEAKLKAALKGTAFGRALIAKLKR